MLKKNTNLVTMIISMIITIMWVEMPYYLLKVVNVRDIILKIMSNSKHLETMMKVMQMQNQIKLLKMLILMALKT